MNSKSDIHLTRAACSRLLSGLACNLDEPIRASDGASGNYTREEAMTLVRPMVGAEFQNVRQLGRGARFWSEVQRVYENRICTSLPSSLRIAWNGVLKPRHFLGVRLAVRMMS